MAYLNIREAAIRLGWSRRQVRKWLGIVQIAPVSRPHDRRCHWLLEEQVEQIRLARAAEERPRAPLLLRTRTASANVAAASPDRVSELLHQVEQLLRSIQQGQPPSARPAAEIRPVPTSVPEQIPPLPRDWMAVSTWCDVHGVDERRITWRIEKERVPAPEEALWLSPQHNRVRRAWSKEAHRAVVQALVSEGKPVRACPLCADILQP